MIMRRRHFIAVCATVVLAACSTLDVGPAPGFERGVTWALLPLANHTETPQAGLRAEAIVEGVLRASGARALKRYPAQLNNESLFEPLDRKQQDAALAWAKGAGARYAIVGAVDEWRYKVGIDGEPAVGMALSVVDLSTGDTIWSASGGRTGWSREALSAVAQKLARALLAPVVAGARQ